MSLVLFGYGCAENTKLFTLFSKIGESSISTLPSPLQSVGKYPNKKFEISKSSKPWSNKSIFSFWYITESIISSEKLFINVYINTIMS